MKFGVTPGGGGNAPITGGAELALMTAQELREIKVVVIGRIKFLLKQYEDRRWALRMFKAFHEQGTKY